jgi:hypothetical protein
MGNSIFKIQKGPKNSNRRGRGGTQRETTAMRNIRITNMFIILVMFSLTLGIVFSAYCEAKSFESLEEFKESLYVGVAEESRMDVNADGLEDIVVFSTGGEETFLDILINKDGNFFQVHLPVGEEYEILIGDIIEFQASIGTFPMFGDMRGPDTFYWDDFYRIDGQQLVKTNSKHVANYQEILPKYERRVIELKKEIKDLETEPEDDDIYKVNDLYISIRRDHISRYIEFIESAKRIINQ